MAADSRATLGDAELVRQIRNGVGSDRWLIDEYYRRCIPIYESFLGRHWHTGWYEPGGPAPSPRDPERMIAVVAASAAIRPGMRVLDVGCGIGGTVGWLAREAGVEAVGLTPVAEQKHRADRRLAREGLDARIEIGHAEAMPFADASFDAVLFFESTCHIADRAALFREALRVLRPGGRLAGEDWMRRSSDGQAGATMMLERIERLWAIPALGSLADYRALIEAAGFDRCSVHDLRDECALERGFAVAPAQQQDLLAEIESCREPLLRLVLEGLLALGQATAAACFTIGRVAAEKPPAGSGAR